MSRRAGRHHKRFTGLPPMDSPEERGRLIKQAHDAFDPLWQSGRVTRDLAYGLLSQELDIPAFFAHFGKMHTVDLRRVPDAVRKIEQKINDT